MSEVSPLRGLLDEMLETLEDLEQRRQIMLGELQQAAIEIGLAAAQRLVWDQLDRGEFPIHAVIDELVERLQTNQPLEIYLHPADLEQLQKSDDRVRPGTALGDAKFVPQPHLARGTVRVEAGKFGVQTSLRGLLIEIRKQLLESLADAQIERRRPVSNDRPLRRHPDRRTSV